MNRLLTMAMVPALIGCSSGGAQARARSAADEANLDAEMTALRVQVDEQEQELRTLRGQLALARAQVQELKGGARRASSPTSRTSDGEDLPWAKSGKGELGMQPVLRLDGEVVDERLSTTSEVPDLPAFEDPVPAAAAPVREEVSVEGYRRGLALVRNQEFQEALIELDTFAAEHSGHPYADNALYWCGEIHYLRREYTQALAYFERVEKAYPWGNKAPDALYRIGQIYLRRGDTARAQAYFDKVREQFPDTAAARLALREDAS